jgi:hypothetical protein
MDVSCGRLMQEHRASESRRGSVPVRQVSALLRESVSEHRVSASREASARERRASALRKELASA